VVTTVFRTEFISSDQYIGSSPRGGGQLPSTARPLCAATSTKSRYGWLTGQLRAASRLASDLGVDWIQLFSQPASEADLHNCEVALGVHFGRSHRDFLALYNGAEIGVGFAVNKAKHRLTIKVLSCNEILVATQEQKKLLADILTPSDLAIYDYPIVVAAYGRSGDFCVTERFDTGDDRPIFDAFNEVPDRWREFRIAANFDEFLQQCVAAFVKEGKTLTYWLEERIEDIRQA
jgi:hypothetical protein